tara:strand:+ start:631 stop:756 length:126 start_codon:yes stop_codon:yes gene_type:complete
MHRIQISERWRIALILLAVIAVLGIVGRTELDVLCAEVVCT